MSNGCFMMGCVMLGVSIVSIGLHTLNTQMIANSCAMSYMYPSYHPVTTSSVTPHYRLLRYKEGNREVNKGVAVLFVPGQAGSYRQVRSLGKALANKEMGRVYTLDFGGEWSALSGVILERQKQFCVDMIRFVHGITGEPIVLVGHSMGGVVGVSAALEVKSLVSVVYALQSPLHQPAIASHSSTVEFYQRLHRSWCDAGEGMPVLSFGGGLRDELVRSDLCAVPRCAKDAHAIVWPSVQGVQRHVDHQCGVWCLEVALWLADAIAQNRTSIADVGAPLLSPYSVHAPADALPEGAFVLADAAGDATGAPYLLPKKGLPSPQYVFWALFETRTLSLRNQDRIRIEPLFSHLAFVATINCTGTFPSRGLWAMRDKDVALTEHYSVSLDEPFAVRPFGRPGALELLVAHSCPDANPTVTIHVDMRATVEHVLRMQMETLYRFVVAFALLVPFAIPTWVLLVASLLYAPLASVSAFAIVHAVAMCVRRCPTFPLRYPLLFAPLAFIDPTLALAVPMLSRLSSHVTIVLLALLPTLSTALIIRVHAWTEGIPQTMTGAPSFVVFAVIALAVLHVDVRASKQPLTAHPLLMGSCVTTAVCITFVQSATHWDQSETLSAVSIFFVVVLVHCFFRMLRSSSLSVP